MTTTHERPGANAPQARSEARAELIGSMVRPRELVDAFSKVFSTRRALGEHPQGQGTPADRQRLAEVTKTEILDLVDRQVDVGVDVLVNGEFSRWVWWMSLFGALDGFAAEREPLAVRDGHGATAITHGPRIDRKVRRVANPAADEARLLAGLTDRPFKITFPAASRELAYWGRPVLWPETYDLGVYESPDEALSDLLELHRQLIFETVDAGASYIQLDYPAYTHAADPSWVKFFRDGGMNRSAVLERAVDADNAVIDGLPPCVTTGLHFCRGNVGDKFAARGSLDEVGEVVFDRLNYNRLLIEWSDAQRHGGFDALRFVPPTTTVVLGLVDTKSHVVESEDQLLKRIDEASRYMDTGQLAISPQCGFSSAVSLNDATDTQWRKIETMCRVADRVWPR